MPHTATPNTGGGTSQDGAQPTDTDISTALTAISSHVRTMLDKSKELSADAKKEIWEVLEQFTDTMLEVKKFISSYHAKLELCWDLLNTDLPEATSSRLARCMLAVCELTIPDVGTKFISLLEALARLRTRAVKAQELLPEDLEFVTQQRETLMRIGSVGALAVLSLVGPFAIGTLTFFEGLALSTAGAAGAMLVAWKGFDFGEILRVIVKDTHEIRTLLITLRSNASIVDESLSTAHDNHQSIALSSSNLRPLLDDLDRSDVRQEVVTHLQTLALKFPTLLQHSQVVKREVTKAINHVLDYNITPSLLKG